MDAAWHLRDGSWEGSWPGGGSEGANVGVQAWAGVKAGRGGGRVTGWGWYRSSVIVLRSTSGHAEPQLHHTIRATVVTF